jgi:hypothetical protein
VSLDVDRIGALVAAANGTEGEFDKIVEGLSQLATPSTRSKVIFDHDELQICLGMPGQFATLNERLTELESLKISPAPVVAAVFSTAEIDVLVLKYWACPGEQRCMFEPKRELPETVRRRFRDDMVKVADAGYMHPWAMRGRLYWRISSTTETILLEEWGVLEPIKNKDDVVALFSSMMNVV